MTLNRCLAFAIVIIYILLGVVVLRSNSLPPHSGAYSSGVNAALNTTLQVGAEWRTLNVHFTWDQLQVEVARRLKVLRVEPWGKGK